MAHRRSLTSCKGFLPAFLAALSIVPAILWAAPPPDAGPPQVVTGELRVVVADDYERGRSEQLHFLDDRRTGASYTLRFDGLAHPSLRSGQVVAVRGRAKGHELFLEANGSGGADVSLLEEAGTQASVSGTQRTAVIMLEFPGLASSCSASAVESMMFTGAPGTTVAGLYEEMSSGVATLSGAVVGPYVLSQGDPASCNPSGWANEADTLASQGGLNLNNYPRRVYVVPNGTSCGYAGLGQVGGSQTRAWVLRCDLRDVYAHELGHNFGWGHAATSSNQYGDISGIMGYSGYPLRHANAPHQTQIGWLDSARVQDVSVDGDYWIEALSLTDGQAVGPQVLRLVKPDDSTFYFVSYRDTVGYDANLASTYRKKMTVHTYSGSGSARTYLVANLADGQSYTDSANGITFTRVSTSGTSVLARVSFDGAVCSPQAPAVSISPASQSGLAGTQLNYTVNVTNRDGAGCSSSSFDLAAAAPSGWTKSVSPSRLSLAPGSSGSATLSVVSASTAPAGNQTVSVSVSDAASSAHAGSAQAVYQVNSSCTAADPQVTLSPSRQSGDAGSSLSFSVSVTNRDSAACAATSFSLTAVRPSGWGGSVSPSNLSLAPGASGSATLSVTSSSTAASGDHAVGARATSSANSAYQASADGVFAVNAAPPEEDAQAPSAPTGLSASVKRNGVNVSWIAASDNVAVAGYRLYRDGGLVIDTASTSYQDKGGAAGSTYYVVAYDAAGNASAPSTPAVATTGSKGGGRSGGGKGGGPKK